ncbi:MAG TPA: tetratricopeptide repeat-containing protein [Burkholderiales bacterium]|nr:tetratricopeptide repeat-containing protein [Burkholderiales bacterium]
MAEAAEWLARVRSLEGRGELLLAYDTALQGLEAHPDDVWLAHRAVLNLAKSGATARAEAEYVRLGLARSQEPDVAALGARIAKDRGLDASGAARSQLLSRAADQYESIYRRAGGYYPGINVATLRLLAGEPQKGEQVAREVLALCESAGGTEEDDYYRAASAAEAALVLGDVSAADKALRRAVGSGSDLAARAATRRQLRLICAARSLPEEVLAPLAPPTVIHYTGHMIAPPGRAGRFKAAQESQVAADVAAKLQQHGVGFGYGALACGADILFAEALLARGAELHVVLPFSRDDFVRASVAPGGPGWVERFEACLQRARTITYATEDSYLGHDWIFSYGSFVAMGLAVLRSRFLDGSVRQIAVWDGEATGGIAGTAFDVGTWRSLNRPADIILCSAPSQQRGPRQPAVAPGRAQGELKTMLFGDVKGFSKLTEAQIPGFVEHVLGTLGRALSEYGNQVLYRNTWGDGLFLVLGDAAAGARCALALQAALQKLDLPAQGLPDTLALRLGGHFGPVFETTDPVQGVTNYFGAHVSRTARIEPVTPPGEVYVTEQFAARLALEPALFGCDYVGQVPAAKGYGTMRMYHLHAPPEKS